MTDYLPAKEDKLFERQNQSWACGNISKDLILKPTVALSRWPKILTENGCVLRTEGSQFWQSSGLTQHLWRVERDAEVDRGSESTRPAHVSETEVQRIVQSNCKHNQQQTYLFSSTLIPTMKIS